MRCFWTPDCDEPAEYVIIAGCLRAEHIIEHCFCVHHAEEWENFSKMMLCSPCWSKPFVYGLDNLMISEYMKIPLHWVPADSVWRYRWTQGN